MNRVSALGLFLRLNSGTKPAGYLTEMAYKQYRPLIHYRRNNVVLAQ